MLRHVPIDRVPLSADRSGHVIARWLGGGNAARTDHELGPELPVILRFDFVMDCPPRRGVRAQGAEDSLPLLIRITRRGSLGRHATLHDGGTVRILTEAVPCDRTAFLRRRDHASHERCAKSEQDKAVSHHAGHLGCCMRRAKFAGRSLRRTAQMEPKGNAWPTRPNMDVAVASHCESSEAAS